MPHTVSTGEKDQKSSAYYDMYIKMVVDLCEHWRTKTCGWFMLTLGYRWLSIEVTACLLRKSPSIIHYTANEIFRVVSSCLMRILVNLAPKTKGLHLKDLFTLLSGFKQNVSRASRGGKQKCPSKDGPKIQFQVGAHK